MRPLGRPRAVTAGHDPAVTESRLRRSGGHARRWSLTALFAWSALLAPPLYAVTSSPEQDLPLPASLQYSLLVRILGFDRKLPARSGSDVVIAVVYQAGFRASQSMYQALEAAAAASPDTMVHGRRIRIVPVALGDTASAARALAAHKASVLYLAPLRGVSVEELVREASASGIMTVSGVAEYSRRGVAVSLVTRGERPHITVDLRTARAAGIDFSAQLLSLVEVLR